MEKLEFIAMLGEGGRDIGRMLEVRRVKGRGEAIVGIWAGGGRGAADSGRERLYCMGFSREKLGFIAMLGEVARDIG